MLFDLRPNYGGGNEGNGDRLQKVPCTASHSAPTPAAGHHQPTPPVETPGHSRASLGQSLVGVTAPFSWVLVHIKFCLCHPRVCFPVLCKFWRLYGVLMVTSSKRAYAIPRSAAPRAPILWKSTADPYLYRTRSNTVLSQFLWSLWVLMHTRFV